MITSGNKDMPYMKSLAICLHSIIKDGYTNDFKIAEDGCLKSVTTDRSYAPEEIQIINSYRFEGSMDPDDNAILYVIITGDGQKGTLVDAFGLKSDPGVRLFISKAKRAQNNRVNERVNQLRAI